ncbi:MAG: hypothetical protein ACXWBO_09320 [Ilumatobacteraceae bacterium]
MIDDLEELEETFGATLQLALRHAIEAVDGGLDPADEDSFVTLRVEPAVRRSRHLLVVAAVAVVLVSATAGTIAFVHTTRRSTPSTRGAVEIAPGWTLGSEGPLGIRTGGVFLWDGVGVVTWGGASDDKTGHLQPAADDGAVYDAATDTWKAIDKAPIAGRRSAKAVWTGSRAVIWGGVDDQGRGLHDGALFDPSSGEWTKMAEAPVEVSAGGSAAVWTGTEMLIWGGPAGSKGAAFDPKTDQWRLLPAAPIASRPIDSATWTETEMIVWSNGDGAAYNPVIDKWRVMASSPLQNAQPRGVWNGSDVVFLGGADTGSLTESAAYHPATDTWQMLAPGPAHPGLGFVWTGSTILGVVKGVVVDYEPITDTWTEIDAKVDALPFGTWGDDRYVFMTGGNAARVRVAFYQPPETQPKVPLPSYTLTLPGTRLRDDEVGTARTTDSALWRHSDGTYVALTVIPREPGGPKGLREPTPVIATFPAARGKAWYGELETTPTTTSSELWWEQPDQSVWLIDAYWYGASPPNSSNVRRDKLVQWALDITTPAEASYELRDPGIQLVGSRKAGTLRDRVQTWNYAGQQIVLDIFENGSRASFADLLSRGVPQPITIESRVGSVVTDVNGGDVTVGWVVDDLTDTWATLSIPAALAGHADDIVHSLRLAG